MKKTVAICLMSVFCILFGLCSSCTTEKQVKKTSELAIMDASSIYKLQAFITANEKIETARRELEASYSEKMKNASPEQERDLRALFEKDMLAVANKERNPLNDRVQAAIAIVAAEKNITVVLDKSVVVTGAEDITDAVKDKFREEGELEHSNMNIGENSSVAYFDQDVVRTLSMFRDVDKKMHEEWIKAREEIASKAKTASAEEIRQLTAKHEKRLSDMNASLTTPLLKKVTDTVSDIAKENNVALVVGKQYVMYGGKNITDLVVDRLLGKTSPKVSGDDNDADAQNGDK